MRPTIDQLATFVTVVDSGSFAGAARVLGVSRSIVSRRVAALEDGLGTRLLNRSTHFLSLTEAGTAFHARMDRVLRDIDDAVSDVSPSRTALSGTIRIAASASFGSQYVMPALGDLMELHPGLDLKLIRRTDALAPLKEGADFAICMGTLTDSSFIARHFKPVARSLVCSPAYAREHGVPQSLPDIADHPCLSFDETATASKWSFRHGNRTDDIRVVPRMQSNDPDAIRDAAEAGLGLAVLPDYVVLPAVEAGRLQIVSEGIKPTPLGLYAVFPPNGRPTPQIRAVVDFLAERWRKPMPELDPQTPSL